MAASALTAAQVTHLAKCDTRLVSLLTEFGVAPETMAAMGENGLDSVGMLAGIADKREDFRLRVIQFLGLDAANGAADAREVARLICAFESSKIRNEVEIRAQAERASNFLPVRVDMLEVDTARKTMLQVEKGLIDELPDEVAPGREYYQWRVNQLTSVLEAEQLTRVTTLALSTAVVLARVSSLAEPADVLVSASAREGAPCTVEPDADGVPGGCLPLCPVGEVGLAPFASAFASFSRRRSGRSLSGSWSVLQCTQTLAPLAGCSLCILEFPLLSFALGLGLRLWGRRGAVLDGELGPPAGRLGCRAPGAKSWGCDCPARVDGDVRVEVRGHEVGVEPGHLDGFDEVDSCVQVAADGFANCKVEDEDVLDLWGRQDVPFQISCCQPPNL